LIASHRLYRLVSGGFYEHQREEDSVSDDERCRRERRTSVRRTRGRADHRKDSVAFTVGDTRLPAGDYRISETSSGPAVLLVESADGTRVSLVSTIVATSTDGNETQPDVEFQTVDKEHFLSRVDMHDGMAREVVLSPSIMEKELVKSAERSGD
jgi:hypothetical protein